MSKFQDSKTGMIYDFQNIQITLAEALAKHPELPTSLIDTSIADRPTDNHVWDNGSWILPPAK